MKIMPFIRHVAKAFMAAGYGGAVPAWAANYPKAALTLGVIGVVAHIVAYKPPKNN